MKAIISLLLVIAIASRDLHSFPTRRSSDLPAQCCQTVYRVGAQPACTRRTNGAHRSQDRKSTRLNSSHVAISYAVFCLKKKTSEFIQNHKKTQPEEDY